MVVAIFLGDLPLLEMAVWGKWGQAWRLGSQGCVTHLGRIPGKNGEEESREESTLQEEHGIGPYPDTQDG